MNTQAYFIKTGVEHLSGCRCSWGPTGQMMGRGLGHASHRAAGGGGEGLAVHELELRGLSISDNRRLARSKSPVVSRACWDPWTPTLGGVSVQAEDIWELSVVTDGQQNSSVVHVFSIFC